MLIDIVRLNKFNFQSFFNSSNVKVVVFVVTHDRSRQGLLFRRTFDILELTFDISHLTDKSDDKVGHLNTILARRGGNLNNPIFKSSNARGRGDVEVSSSSAHKPWTDSIGP